MRIALISSAFQLGLILCFLLQHVAVATGAEHEKPEHEQSETYILRELSTLYGKTKHETWEEFYGRRETQLCKVVRLGDRFALCGCGDVEEQDIGTQPAKWIVGNKSYTVETSYWLTKGRDFEGAPPDSVFFMPTVPFVGFELFYLPQFNLKNNRLVHAHGIQEIQSVPALSPGFKGHWAYSTEELDKNHLTISGPYHVVSNNKHYQISGTLRKDIQLKPFAFTRLSGNCMISITPPEKFMFFGKPTGKFAEVLGKFTHVVGRHQFLMVPRDSDEAKSIPVPKKLSAAFAEQFE